MPDQHGVKMGGTMRLGAYPCKVLGNIMKTSYGEDSVSERHRHRYEFNNDFRSRFEEAGMACVGENPATKLVEVVEIPGKRWFIGTQYHPEYSSTVLSPNPIFASFIKAAIAYGEEKAGK